MQPSTEQMRTMVEAAVKAPSSHNTQPWIFEIKQNGVDLRADRTRALPVTDPYDRELAISCGAALFTLEIAASGQGFEPNVSVLPDPSDPDLVARLVVDGPATRASSTADLVEAIETRHTTREAFDSTEDLEELKSTLAVAAKEHDVHLLLDVDRDALGDFVAEGDRSQFSDPHWRRELASWMHPRRKGDGLIVPEVFGLATRAVVSLINLGSSTAQADQDLVADAPIIGVLSTDSDDARSWVEVGRGLQHLLLVAAAAGVSAGFQNQPCQVAEIRGRFHAFLGDQGFPQIVIRLGRVDPPKQRAPRRPLDDVLTVVTS